MGMFAELAIEGVVRGVVLQVKKDLEENRESSEACRALKGIGRFTLTMLETSPDWETEYQELFKE